MLENKRLMKSNINIIVKYGLILGLVFVVLSVLIYVFNLITISFWAGTIIGVANLALLIAGLIIAGKHYRKNYGGGYIRYMGVFKVLILVVLISSLVSTAYSLLFSTVIDPGYEQRVKLEIAQKTAEYMANQNVPEAQIDKMIDNMTKPSEDSMLSKMLWSFLGSVLFGVIVSAIVSIFVKKNPPLFEQNAETAVSNIEEPQQ